MSTNVWLGDDGIVRVDYGNDPLLDLAAVKSAVAQRIALVGRPHPVMVIGGGHPHVTPDAKAYTRSAEVVQMTTAMAFVTESFWARNMVQLFRLFDAPPYPVYVFSDQIEAAAWLRRFVLPDNPGPR